MRTVLSPSLPPHPPLPRYYQGTGAEPGLRSDVARREFVNRLFDRTAPQYDWLDRVMSLGAGRRYRREALERAGLKRGMRVLDVGVGTGLTAQAALELIQEPASVTGLDSSLGMLREARPIGIPLVRAAAEDLPISSRSFDFVSMGYALRHVSDLKATFREYHRVLKPGGRLVLLELTRPTGSRWRYQILRLYLQKLVPLLARWGPGGPEAGTLMEYYRETIDKCVPPDSVLQSLREAGFVGVERRVAWAVLTEYVAIAERGA